MCFYVHFCCNINLQTLKEKKPSTVGLVSSYWRTKHTVPIKKDKQKNALYNWDKTWPGRLLCKTEWSHGYVERDSWKTETPNNRRLIYHGDKRRPQELQQPWGQSLTNWWWICMALAGALTVGRLTRGPLGWPSKKEARISLSVQCFEMIILLV